MHEPLQTAYLPINLRVADRLCLVVGGGRVALRKCTSLLAAGARVRLVSPERCPEFSPLLAAHPIEAIQRPFAQHDLHAVTLVFACTDDRAVNRHILAACRQAKILCSCVDGNWADSDFTSPAVTRHGGLTLTVSTGGRSCRHAKLVKDSLARHMESIETADLLVAGTDHRYLDLAQREPFHLAGARLERVGGMLMQLFGVHEFMLLNTCNRVEIMAVASHATAASGLLCHALGFDRLPEDRYYQLAGAEAWEHSALVCAGMLSQTPGENPIAGQMKAALALARKRGWAAGMLQEWMDSALHTSKHIKHDVVPDIPVREIEDLALAALARHAAREPVKNLIVVGSGMVGRALVAAAVRSVPQIVWCYHRHRPALPDAGPGQIALCPMSKLADRLPAASAVICAVEAKGYVLDHTHADRFAPNRETLLIDLGVPRNIDPTLGHASQNLERIDMETLKQADANRQQALAPYIRRCRGIIHAHRAQYEKLMESFQGANP